jgi:beta-lactamase class A
VENALDGRAHVGNRVTERPRDLSSRGRDRAADRLGLEALRAVALGTAVGVGRVGWDQPLTITPQLKSLHSGVLQYKPMACRSRFGTATKMISVSDNTATDMMINLVGRSRSSGADTTGMAEPALDRPFQTTR